MGNCGPLRVPRKPKVILTTSAASDDSGTQMVEAIGFSQFGFQIAPATVGQTVSGFSVVIYGTLDPNAVLDNGKPNPAYPAPGGAGGAWFELPSVTAGSGNDTQTYANPLTAITQALYYRGPALVAVRAISTGTAQTGTINVLAWAID